MVLTELPAVRGIQAISGELRAKLHHPVPVTTPQPQEIFQSVAVIGAGGKIGGLFTETLSLASGARVDPVLHGGIADALFKEPDVVIMATPNPTKDALQEIAQNIKKPITLILPQNGVDVVSTAEKILGSSRNQIRIVRASVFTKVTRDEEGNIVYNQDKNRIALSIAPEDGKKANKEEKESLKKVKNLLGQAGFKVKTVSDYESMEWTKLVANLFGSTSTITGSSPLETFNDSSLYAMEMRGLKDRLDVLNRAHIKPAHLWGIGKLRLLSRFGWLGIDHNILRRKYDGSKFRGYVAGEFAAERNNQPAEAAKEIVRGERKVEPTDSYHKPFTKLAHELDVEIPVDETMVDILLRHEKGANPEKTNFDLASLSDEAKRDLILEIYGYESQDVFIKRASFLGVPYLRLGLERIYEWYVDHFNVSGKENLASVSKTLKSGKSVIIAPNHRSHGDHTTVIKALRESLPFGTLWEYPVFVIAGMKFDKEDISNRFNKAYSHPVVWTRTEGDDEETVWRAQMVNGRSVTRIKKMLEKKPSILVVYFEGGRNKDGLGVQDAVLGGGIWLLNSKIGLVVPTFIEGTQKLLAPGEQKPSHADVNVEFLKAIDTAELHQEEAQVDHKKRDMHFSRKILNIISDRQKQRAA